MKIKKFNLHWLLLLFVTVCESTSTSYNHPYSAASKTVSSDYRERAAQLRKARSSSNSPTNNLTSALNASALHKVSFLPEDSFEPTKPQRHYTHRHYPKTYVPKHGGANIKRDLSEPVGFLNAVVNDHATSSTNQDTDTVRYPPNKAYKSSLSNSEPQSFSRRQRDFSESSLSNPTSSASDANESMNSDDHKSDSGGGPFSSSGSSAGSGSSSSHDDSPVDSNEDFPSSPTNSAGSSSGSSNAASSAGGMDDEAPVPYDSFGPSSGDDEHHARGNSLDEDEHHHHSPASGPQTLSSRPPSLPYGTNPYLSSLSPYGPPPMGPPMGSSYRGIYSAGPPPISFPGYRSPITSPLTYPLISSASSSPLAGSYKAMSSEAYPAGKIMILNNKKKKNEFLFLNKNKIKLLNIDI